uniref:Uncharacterized protein n=1 Tax=Arundo donax TaxID=35708 RepID=A0A0A9E680_ARUDO
MKNLKPSPFCPCFSSTSCDPLSFFCHSPSYSSICSARLHLELFSLATSWLFLHNE